ncbi:activating transcription factor 7-interacting protein 1 [Anopheles merus]|uniref:activating transcription factor 7-interacting protein 1 n=1 Tax=Anopheles merus TaxID=30066 RepID=UPI001BE3EB54|nr:activating transcription factor 7-interacting protein 1 [Anopheles merus]XP_041770227.1 activating transcription factor 7-interacting protein 1 [Anopheles merus]
MMDVDQPVSSTNDKEQSAPDAETAQELVAEKSPGVVGRENDDLPALLISDSEEDDPPKTPAGEEGKSMASDNSEPAKPDVAPGDISGITPIEKTIVSLDVKDKHDDHEAKKEQTTVAETDDQSSQKPAERQKPASLSPPDDEDLSLVENIDLTGVSSAEESGISEEPSSEKPAQKVKKATVAAPPTTPAKSSSEMTAQELLQSLLGAQEEAFAAHQASDANRSDLIEFNDKTVDQRKDGASVPDDTVVTLDDTSICLTDGKANEGKDNGLSGVSVPPESTATTLQPNSDKVEQAAISSDTEKCSADKHCESGTQGAIVPAVDCSDAVPIDEDVCMLEEMPNVAKSQRQPEANEGRSSPCISEKPEGTSTDVAKDVARDKPAPVGNDNGDHAKVTDTDADRMDESEASEANEPPRKKARSMSAADEYPSTEPADSSSHGKQHETREGKEQSATDAANIDNLNNPSKEQMDVPARLNIDLLEAQAKSAAVDSLRPNAETRSGAAHENNATEHSNPANKQCVAADAKKRTTAPEPSVYPYVLVIDDDDDEDEADKKTAGDDTKVQSMNHSDKNVMADSAPADGKQSSDAAAKQSVAVESKVRLSPIPPELKSAVPMRMDFVRRFCKPFTEMTRSDLEQLVLQKISEALVYKSDNAALRAIIKKQAVKLQGFERSLADMTSHYEALKLVADRAVEDMKKRANTYIAPVKITRAVGLQVSRGGYAAEPGTGHKPSSSSSGKRKGESAAMATAAVNGVSEHGGGMREVSSEIAKRPGQQAVIGGVQRVTVQRHHVPNNAPQMITTRTSPNNSTTANGVARSFKPYVAKLSNTVTTVATFTPPFTPNRLSINAGDGSNAVPAPNNTPPPLASAATSSDSGTNSVSPGIDSPVRKKQLQKITPMRPPLSAYQQAQQEKQARQQQELLLQQIHEQSQQVQRKAQTNARQDVQPGENSLARPGVDNSIRPRPVNVQARVLNSNPPPLATSSFQLASVSALRTSSTTVSSTTSLSTQKRPNPQPSSTVVSSSVDDSLIDLTEEDETQGGEGDTTSSNAAKRPRPSLNGAQTFALAQAPTAIPTSQVATNQLMRIQARLAKPDGSGAIATVASNSPVVSPVYQHNGVVVRPAINVKRVNAPPLQPIRQPIYTSSVPRPPVSSTDQALMKKRIVVKPSIQALIVPLPPPGPQPENDPSWKLPPPQPTICVNNVQTGIVISWLMPTLDHRHSEIENYQIYAYQELAVPNAVEEWRHVGDVKALLLPMAVTLTQFQEGQRYYFAVRAIDKHKRVGMFSDPRTWSECSVSNA